MTRANKLHVTQSESTGAVLCWSRKLWDGSTVL